MNLNSSPVRARLDAEGSREGTKGRESRHLFTVQGLFLKRQQDVAVQRSPQGCLIYIYIYIYIYRERERETHTHTISYYNNTQHNSILYHSISHDNTLNILCYIILHYVMICYIILDCIIPVLWPYGQFSKRQSGGMAPSELVY